MAEFHEIGSSQFTEVTPAGTEQIQISATQKTTLQKIANLFKAMSANLTGFTPLGKGAPSINSSSTILRAFQALYQLVGSAKVKILGNNGSTPGFVSWSGTTCYGILFDTTSEQVYIRNSWTISNPSEQTDEQWIAAIKAGKAIKFGGSVNSIADLKISGWSDITKYDDVQYPYIINGDTLINAMRKLQWMTGNNTIKTFGNASGVGMMWWDGDAQMDLFTAFYFNIETRKLAIIFKDNLTELGVKSTNDQIISYIVSNGTHIYLDDNYQTAMTYSISSGSLTLQGSSSVWYTGSANPTVTINGNLFSEKSPTAYFICPYHITPSFVSLSNTNTILHLPKTSTESATSGYRVYTLYCHKVSEQTRIVGDRTKSHIFISLVWHK